MSCNEHQQDADNLFVASDSPAPNGGEAIEGAVIFPPSFPYPELLALGEFLEAADILTPGYIPPPVGLCHPDGFIYEKNFEGIKTILLPDRNVALSQALCLSQKRFCLSFNN